MERKARGTCAGVLASLVAILSVGCGADSLPPSTSARKAAPPVRGQSLARDAVEVAQQTDTLGADTAREIGSRLSDDAVVVEPAAVEPVEVEAYPTEAVSPTDADELASGTEESTEVDAAQEPTPAAIALEPAPHEAVDEDAFAADDESAATPVEVAADGATIENEADDEIRAADSASDADNVIRFTMPGAESPAAQEAAEQPTPDAGPRRSLIRLAIQPRDAATVEAAPSDDATTQEDGSEFPAGPKSELKPLVVTPIEAPHELLPQAVAGQPEAGEAAAPQAAAPQTEALPPVAKPRSGAMIATLARADERVRHGIQLAQKGALYAARREFTTAIRLIAQANDVEHGTRQYTKAAIAGFQAIKEANDLVGQYAGLGEASVARITTGHKTKILNEADMVDMPPTVAAGYYYEYAREQLAEAIGRQTVGSIALYGLGKIMIIGAGPNSQQLEYTGPAMALYQAALMAEPENYRAAHELGVLLAGAGQLEMARELLINSAVKSPQPIIWRNLAMLHNRMGQRQLAAQAQQQADALQQTSSTSKTPQVDWVDPVTFASTPTPGSDLTPPAAPAQTPANSSEAASAPTKPAANVARKRYSEWNPLNLRR